MIHHLSIPAKNPSHVAEILAQLWEGKATPFPPNPGSYVAFALDSRGSLIEVYPQGTQLQPGKTDTAELEFHFDSQTPSYIATHAAIAVKVDEEKIKEIADKEGWRAVKCDRDGVFEVIEFWVENQVLLELLTPELAEKYLSFTNPKVLEEYFNSQVG